MAVVQSIELTKMVEKLNLKNETPDIDMSGMKLVTPEVNGRPCS